jgi:hypothetical protein
VRISGAAVFSALLSGVAAYAVLTALRWPPKAALFPLVMGIPLLVLALAQMVIDLRGAAAPQDAPGRGQAAISVLGWMVLFVVFVLLVGFPLSVPLFIFGYLVLSGRERWPLSLALAGIAWGLFYLLFEKLLHFPFDAGVLFGGGT